MTDYAQEIGKNMMELGSDIAKKAKEGLSNIHQYPSLITAGANNEPNVNWQPIMRGGHDNAQAIIQGGSYEDVNDRELKDAAERLRRTDSDTTQRESQTRKSRLATEFAG